MAKMLSLAERLSPSMLDRYMLFRNRMLRQQFTARPDRGQSNLFASTNETRVEGDFAAEMRGPRRPGRG